MLVYQVAHMIYACCYKALFHEVCRRRRWPWHHWHVSTKVTMAAPSCFLVPSYPPSALFWDLRPLSADVRFEERALALLFEVTVFHSDCWDIFEWRIMVQSSSCAMFLFKSTKRFHDHLSEHHCQGYKIMVMD